MYNDVKTFIDACEQKRDNINAKLYHRLIEEEFEEFLVARGMQNEVETLDACMDMIWVILGFCYMRGYDVDGAWAEVARSNLSKINPETGKVIKREDGKVLKPVNWMPPQLDKFV